MDTARFKPAIVYTIYIASTPEKVWQALTSAEFSRMYFFGNAAQVDSRVGGAYVVRTPAILSSLKSVLKTGRPPVVQMAPRQRMLDALKAMRIRMPGFCGRRRPGMTVAYPGSGAMRRR